MHRSAAPQPGRSRKLTWIAAGVACAAVVGVGAWLWLRPAPVPGPVVSLPAPVTVPAPSGPVVAPRFLVRAATEAEIVAHEATEMTVFRFQPNPRILVLDFPDLQQQGLMLNRIAALAEKKGLPRDRLLTDDELDAAIAAQGDTMATYYYGHDYAIAEIARFFALAEAQHLRLRPQEETLRALLAQEGLLTPGTTGAVISVPRAGSGDGIDLGLRTGILHHELSHGEYFTNAAYAAYARHFWRDDLDEPAREVFRRYLDSQDYDRALDDLMINEMQAYLMHTPDPRLFSAQVLGMDSARFLRLQAAFLTGMPGGWLRDCTAGPPAPSATAAKPRRRRQALRRRAGSARLGLDHDRPRGKPHVLALSLIQRGLQGA
jgi:hypothetical protein